MEPHRRPSGRRALLPAEVELCKAVGLSQEEYWFFVEKAEQYNGERSEAYALVPDISNGPVGPILVQLAIGLILAGAAYLLTPKPKSPEVEDGPRDLRLGGGRGQNRFAQTEGFSAVQELATAGQTIPLVFAKRVGSLGGVRVNGSLVWSQMIAEKGYQQLRAVFAFSDGVTEGVPDYAGLAVGDTLLEGYTAKKVAAYWRQNGGRLLEPANRISGSEAPNLPYSDAFSTYFDAGGASLTGGVEPYFSGATFTSTQSKFGAYAPMFGNTCYRPTPELILKPEDGEEDFVEDLRTKEDLNNTKFSQGSFFRSVIDTAGTETVGYEGSVAENDKILYRLTTYVEDQKDPEYSPHQLGFVNSATISARSNADKQISKGELYLVGDKALAVCTNIEGSAGADELWAPSIYSSDVIGLNTNGKTATFTITEPGLVQTIDPVGVGDIAGSEANAVLNPKDTAFAYPLQRASVATVSNTRPCSATELIIKSNVWRQISGFTDITAWPSETLIHEYQKNNSNIQLGTVNKYVRRLSFFMLEVRSAGTTDWIDVTGDKYFFVEGNAPVDQYHYIRVDTAAKGVVETEFRLRPVSGVGALRKTQERGAVMRKLQYGYEAPPYYAGGYAIVFNGKEVFLTEEYLTNPEFVRASSRESVETPGALENISLSKTEAGAFPSTEPTYSWKKIEDRYNIAPGQGNFMAKRISYLDITDNYYEYLWDNIRRASGTMDNHSIEPPQYVDDNRVPGVKYSWFLPDPSRENDTIIQFPYKYVYRSISLYRWLATPPPALVPTDARITPAKNSAVKNPDADGLKFFVQRYVTSAGTGYRWSVDINNRGTNYNDGDFVIVQWEPVEGSGQYIDIHGVFISGTKTITVDTFDRDKFNYSNFDTIQDVSAFEGVTSSNQNGPEHEIVSVNEKLAQQPPLYDAMTIGGLRINSSQEWSSFNSFSAYMQKGIVLENLIDGSAVASNLLPDIVFGMMTNTDWGAGEVLGPHQVDKDSMKIASQFCNANDFTWDGVISERINFRDWVFRNAQYALLDATIIGGRFALAPAVPYTTTFGIGNNLRPNIKALFTDGNMRDMKVQWLDPKERQLFQAEMLWRQETLNGFAKTKQFTMRLADAEGGSSKDPVETFDMSGFCTSQLHAARYAFYALRLRQQVDHSITFQTTPQAAMGLTPGDYFKVASNSTHTSRFNNGSINDEGYVTSVDDLADGSYSVYFWNVGTEAVREGTIVVSDGKVSDSTFFNTVFTVVMTSEQKRIYKLEALTYGEDGLIEISGSHMPLTNTGSLKILDWNPNDFVGLGIILN